MGNALTVALIAEAKAKCEVGVGYHSRHGAVCPVCQTKRIPIFSSPRWRDGIKVRYHKCTNPKCLVCAMGLTVKSIELG